MVDLISKKTIEQREVYKTFSTRKTISLDKIINRPTITLNGYTTENFIKLINEIKEKIK